MPNGFEKVTSIKDSRIIAARKLSSTAGRQAAGKILLPGEEVILWALQSGLTFEHVFFDDRLQLDHPLLAVLQQKGIPCLCVTEGVLKKISDTHYLIPWIGVGEIATSTNRTPGSFILVLDDIKDHGNLGSMIRTAWGFGIRDVLFTKPDIDLYTKKTIDASRGTVFQVYLTAAPSPADAIRYLKHNGYQIIATSPHARQIQSMSRLQSKPAALVIGNETNGVCSEILQAADLLVQIPMRNDLESLNVSVAAGISIYEFKYKMIMAMLIQNIRSTLGREINVTGKLIQQVLDSHLKGISPVNSTQLVLLMVMKCDQYMSRKQISKDTACFGEELDILLQPLLDAGYIDQDAGQTPETLTITGKGEELLGSLWNVIESSEDLLLKGFSENEICQLKDYLNRLQKNAIKLITEN